LPKPGGQHCGRAREEGGAELVIRKEEERDRAGVYAVNVAAFARPGEAKLVDVLRESADPAVSLVAEENERVVGHIMFSPVVITGHPDLKVMGLGPMAVLPERQRTGIGSLLVKSGLDECRKLGSGAVVVLGHPWFYPRFGFVPASRFGLKCEFNVPDEVFMALELVPGYLSGVSGTVQYHKAFRSL